MVELADIVRAAGPAYVTAHAGALLPSQRRALTYIGQCRTAALGGSLYRCDDCGALDYRYHSCRNRHCPKCQADRAQQWLERVRARLLPCEYYLLTFTLPAQLRALARRHQRLVYSALLREAAASVQAVAEDRAWIGGTPGILAVLHTWSRTLDDHPHVHLLVTAGGLTPDGTAWIRPAHPRFLLPGYVLSLIFRAKMRDALARADLAAEVDARVWQRRWTVHVEHVGAGDHATLYLARYVYRVALTNRRLERFAEGRVTFQYTHGRTHTTRSLTLPVDEFPDTRAPPHPAARLHQGPLVRAAQRQPARRPRTGASSRGAGAAARCGRAAGHDSRHRARATRGHAAGSGVTVPDPMPGVRSRPLGARPTRPARARPAVMLARRVRLGSAPGVPLATGTAQPGCIPPRGPPLPNGSADGPRRTDLPGRPPTEYRRGRAHHPWAPVPVD